MTEQEIDAKVLDGLAVLTDKEIERVQAHLAAGLPMILDWGYRTSDGDGPAACGCLVGVAMGKAEAFRGRRAELSNRTSHGFVMLVCHTPAPAGYISSSSADWMTTPVNETVRARLASLLDVEWSRRHPGTAKAPAKPALIPAVPEPVKETVGV